MNHKKVYESIIKNAKSKNRKKYNGVYYEEHHIFPKSLGSTDDENNKVLLTAKEHFICHKLLTYIYKNNRKMTCAFHFMCFSKKYGNIVSARDYKYIRELLNSSPVSKETREKLSKSLTGRPFSKKGMPISEEHKNKISIGVSGEKNGMYGKKHTLKSIKKNRNSNLGKKHTEETKKKMSLSHKGSKRTEETKQRMRESWKKRKKRFPMSEETKRKIGENTKKHRTGTHHSEETKLKMSNIQRGRKQKRVKCIYCKKECTPSTLSRWHNDNCKFKLSL
jgi:hypothetical protein